MRTSAIRSALIGLTIPVAQPTLAQELVYSHFTSPTSEDVDLPDRYFKTITEATGGDADGEGRSRRGARVADHDIVGRVIRCGGRGDADLQLHAV
ncbi:hypothetical protein SAMN04488094_103319 [Tropicimonas isoalkanivorans]|uniref:Uncharacterized protein n=1 Tax=Tropicimonas isoalkanivorans TaxID=441112 RepID=A0A1I1HXB5_9RHOB|nr:hypothetical protein SAMN04488094_103319 [Tropicimonas isoalkanivorans]